jgi:hypothetical protein
MMLLQTLTLVSIALALVYLVATTAAGLVLALRAGGRREIQAEDHDALSESRFTIPVSLIVHLTHRSPNADDTIAALLGLNYPEIEVIVVTERATPAIWDAMKREWQLEAKEFFYRQSLPTAPVRMIYRSERDARLMVVDKAPGAPADALNCGVNLARFRYVSAVAPGLVFDADALIRAMTAPMRNPAVVVGATSHVEVDAPAGSARTMTRVFQRLASMRSIMESRIVWRTLRNGFAPRDAVVVWRRDALVLSGGFSTTAADADLDMMVRLQTSTAPGVGGQIVRTAEIFGCVEPRALSAAMAATARRQLAALQAISLLVRSKRSDTPALMYFAGAELLTPLAQGWLVCATAIGAAGGWITKGDFMLVVLLLSLGNAILSGAALLLRGSAPDAPGERRLRELLVVAPLAFVVGAAAAACARTAGVLAFVKTSLMPGRAA